MFGTVGKLLLAGVLASVASVSGAQAADRIFAVEAASVKSLTVWVESTEKVNKLINGIKIPIPRRLVEKKVSKRTEIGGKEYFIVSLSPAKAATAARLCATVPKGWLVKWNGGWTDDIGQPSRTLCSGGSLRWSNDVTVLSLTVKAE
ncbi:MAG: hypothetical protein EOP22_15285 [Hyphomicrobiales bacterium]|nr:MAG: hypothetical protein EOP22_15285 [Hyphomicrobiales bacterium]